ncbi:MAG: DUF3592 domain-containing protein [Candidatus Sumerlaeia bacterium]|nr:DUF3592 domain-containing protein [Candidatus Sumerlaeia bacterium]
MNVRFRSKPAKYDSGRHTAPGCLIPFFLIFAIAGAAAGFFLFRNIQKGREVENTWPQVPARIISSQIITNHDSDGNTYRPEFTYVYEFEGRQESATGHSPARFSSGYGWANRRLAEHPVGSETMVYVNPADPSEAYIEGASGMLWLFLLIPAVFIAVGIGGPVWVLRSRSAESTALPAPSAADLSQRTPSGSGKAFGCFPAAPKTTPGRRLAVSIPPETSGVARIIGLLLVSIIWNGISWVGFVSVYREQGWAFPTFFLLLFVLVGAGLISGFVHAVLRVFLTGSTELELDREPMRPGGYSRLVVRQHGRNRINQLSVKVLCRESVTYRQGTSTVTHTETVYEYPLADLSGGESRPGQPFEFTTEFALPEEAMHSFQASNNKIVWSVEVKMDIPGKPDVHDQFVFRVAPPMGA